MNISTNELRIHQIAYYTMLLMDAKSDEQKRFLRTQLYNLKKSKHVNRSVNRSIPNMPLSGLQRG